MSAPEHLTAAHTTCIISLPYLAEDSSLFPVVQAKILQPPFTFSPAPLTSHICSTSWCCSVKNLETDQMISEVVSLLLLLRPSPSSLLQPSSGSLASALPSVVCSQHSNLTDSLNKPPSDPDPPLLIIWLPSY